MFDGLHDIDWSRMHHAYGTAEQVPALLLALASPDERERDDALGDFHGAVHHQGDVYGCTAASMPFLFELAGDTEAPNRAAVVELLVSIGRAAHRFVAHGFAAHGPVVGEPAAHESPTATADVDRDHSGHVAAAALMRERAGVLIGLATAADRPVRRAAIPALGLFVEDAERAVTVLRERLAAEPGAVERQLLVEAAATLALRRPDAAGPVASWLTALAGGTAPDPATRLAAVVHRARCAPGFPAEETTRAAVALLRAQPVPTARRPHRPAPERRAPAVLDGVPAHIAAAFEALDRETTDHSPLTGLLRTLHEALDARVPERTALLTEQLRSEDPGARLDALRMAGDVIRSWRGDHTPLVARIAGLLADPWPGVVAEAASVLGACAPVAAAARPALAAAVAAQRAQYGPQVWADQDREVRRAHQESVLALAGLGDERALPSLLVALDGGTDAWRAVRAVRWLPGAAGQWVPGLVERLLAFDPQQRATGAETASALAALGHLADPSTFRAVEDVLDRAGAARGLIHNIRGRRRY
ncbi:hypothetical protein ACFCX4_35560 [Kitasatospora sp. NPDC056327]|uniref:hypothetical protein n=1 Tax=Kitasatospora sp. NPDC056327 TaxID=3345785 RepID=UPI0035DB3B7B